MEAHQIDLSDLLQGFISRLTWALWCTGYTVRAQWLNYKRAEGVRNGSHLSSSLFTKSISLALRYAFFGWGNELIIVSLNITDANKTRKENKTESQRCVKTKGHNERVCFFFYNTLAAAALLFLRHGWQ